MEFSPLLLPVGVGVGVDNSFFFLPLSLSLPSTEKKESESEREKERRRESSLSLFRHVGLYLDMGPVRQSRLPQVAPDLQSGGGGARGAAMVIGSAGSGGGGHFGKRQLERHHPKSKLSLSSRSHLIILIQFQRRFCEMNPDVTYASCDAPQEKTDKEVELDEDGNEVRERAIVLFLRLTSMTSHLSSSLSTPLERAQSQRQPRGRA